MVYRGKPSAGCEACRKAKKKCTLEQPACTRCVKLNKICSGYRDTSALQIQDETQFVTQRAEKKKAQQPKPRAPQPTPSAPDLAAPLSWDWQSPTPSPPSADCGADGSTRKEPTLSALSAFLSRSTTPAAATTPGTAPSDSSSGSSNGLIDGDLDDECHLFNLADRSQDNSLDKFQWPPSMLPGSIMPKPEDVAIHYFLSCFTFNGHWDYVPRYAAIPDMDPCLTLAIKACGMAALDNVKFVPEGRAWSRKLYVQALGMLNGALRDSKRSRKDESLIAVSMLGLYENLVCDSKQSIQSWKAHIKGATQMLKMRGKPQFKSMVGRALFRETRAQIMIHCLWDDLEPPPFLTDWQPELEANSPDMNFIRPADTLIATCLDFANLENKIKFNRISDTLAMEELNEIDRRMIQWSIDTTDHDERWRYYDMQVDDSPNVWNGMVHAYSGLPAPGVWNSYRSVRIMVTRAQELMSRRFNPSPADQAAQRTYFRAVRRQLTDDICATIPCALGQAQPAFSSPCVLITAYNSIWPLFFAGTCVLERIGHSPWQDDPLLSSVDTFTSSSSAALAQISWILGRFDYISHCIGLHWADGVAATLRGDFRIHDDLMPDPDTFNGAVLGSSNESFHQDSRSPLVKMIVAAGAKKPAWVQELEKSGRGPKVFIEDEEPADVAMHKGQTKWLGHMADVDEVAKNVRPRSAFEQLVAAQSGVQS